MYGINHFKAGKSFSSENLDKIITSNYANEMINEQINRQTDQDIRTRL